MKVFQSGKARVCPRHAWGALEDIRLGIYVPIEIYVWVYQAIFRRFPLYLTISDWSCYLCSCSSPCSGQGSPVITALRGKGFLLTYLIHLGLNQTGYLKTSAQAYGNNLSDLE